ncbi:hypothetical protein JCM10207_005720 [Rhodosporidiobolus poonsookiae]
MVQNRSDPPSLFLPDELLSHVYEHLLPPMPPCDDWRDRKDLHKSSLMPTSLILDNRRILRVAQPIQRRTLALVLSGRRNPQADLTRLAKDYLPKRVTDSLKLLTNVRHLHLRAERSVSRELRTAVWVTIPAGEELDDLSFSVERDLPHLQHLTVAGSRDFSRAVLDNGVRGVECLTLVGTFPGDTILPWSTIRSLELVSVEGGYFREGRNLVAQLKAALEQDAVALESLTLKHANIDLQRHPDAEYNMVYREELPRDLLELLQLQTTLRRVELRGFTYLLWWDCDLQLPSVEVLVFEEKGDRFSPDSNLDSLTPFLAIFPSLHTLHLVFLSLVPASTRATLLAADPLGPALSPPDTFVHNAPELQKVLELLERSEVVDLRYRVHADAPVELRFKRETKREPFEAEWWWL